MHNKGVTPSFADVQNDYATLIEHIGKARFPNGKKLSEILTLDGIPFWDIFSAELAWRHLTTAVAATTPLAKLRLLAKPLVLRFKDGLQYRPHDDSGCLGWPSGPTLLCLGFTPRMYRDVLEPVIDGLTKDGAWQAVVLGEGSRGQSLCRHVLHQSIWQHWGSEPHQRAIELGNSLRHIESELTPRNLMDLLPDAHRHLSQAVKKVFYLLFKCYLPLMLPRAALARHILDKHRPSIVLSPDTSDARTRMYTLIGREMNIPSMDIQFGLAGEEAVEWRFFAADRVAVWGESSKIELCKQNVPEEKILLAGSPRHDALVRPSQKVVDALRERLRLMDGCPVILLASTYVDSTHTEFVKPEVLRSMKCAIFEMVKKIPGIILVVKPHPHENVRETRALVGDVSNIVFADQVSDIRELIVMCDAFVSFGSTATIDAMIAGKLSICPVFPGWPFSEEFRKSGAVLAPDTPDQISDIFTRIAKGEQQELAEALQVARQSYLKHIAYKADGLASYRIGREVLRVVGVRSAQ